MKQFNYRIFFDLYDHVIQTNNHIGSVHNGTGKTTSFARPFGYIPKCVPAPRDKTWMEEQKMPEKSYAELYISAMDDFINGRYKGRYPLWSKYWDMIKEINGIGHSIYPGMS